MAMEKRGSQVYGQCLAAIARLRLLTWQDRNEFEQEKKKRLKG